MGVDYLQLSNTQMTTNLNVTGKHDLQATQTFYQSYMNSFSFSPAKNNMRFRNVRNMKDLYEERSYQCKNNDVQDQINLGV